MAQAVLAVLQAVRPDTLHDPPNWDEFSRITKSATVEEIYLQIVREGAAKAAHFGASLALEEPRAVALARQRAAELVVGISSESRSAVQVAVSSSLQGQFTPQESARLIQLVVGLDARRAQAVANYRNALLMVQSGQLDPSGVMSDFALSGRVGQTISDGRVELLTDQYANRQLASRASTIARTETMRAAQDGQSALWNQAADRGLFDRATTKVLWVLSAEACALCETNSAASPAPFDDGWPNGPPPVHPNCMCDLSLDFGF